MAVFGPVANNKECLELRWNIDFGFELLLSFIQRHTYISVQIRHASIIPLLANLNLMLLKWKYEVNCGTIYKNSNQIFRKFKILPK